MNSPKMCHVAFIDIMGFANFVDKNPPEKVHEYLTKLIEITDMFYKKPHNYNWSIFSDTVIISVPVESNNIIQFNEFILYASTLQLSNIILDVLGELPLRGAITTGEFFTNGKNIIFGKAMVEAYKAESNLAVYPRIIVAEKDSRNYGSGMNPKVSRNAHKKMSDFHSLPDIPEKFRDMFNYHHIEYSQPLRYDFDGILHCNYLCSLMSISNNKWTSDAQQGIEDHKKFIERKLKEESMDVKILAKYCWMKTYHNWFCSGYEELTAYLILDEVTP